MTSSIAIQGIPIANVSMDDAIETIREAAVTPATNHFCFLNADCANLAYANEEYKQVLSGCDGVFADGSGLKIAGQILNRPVVDNVNGTDLFPLLCDDFQGRDISVYLLGARPGITDRVAAWIKKKYPGTMVAGHRNGYFSEDETSGVIEQINRSGADLLLVAFGAPRQDVWIHQHLDQLQVKAAIGVGGLFDFYSGRIPRAPMWMRKLGIEWLFRMLQEPKRLWKRYLIGNIVFMVHVFREKLGLDKYYPTPTS